MHIIIKKKINCIQEFYPNIRSKKTRKRIVQVEGCFCIKSISKEETKTAFIIHDRNSVYNPRKDDTDYIMTHREILCYKNKLFKEAIIKSGKYIGENKNIDDLVDFVVSCNHFRFNNHLFYQNDEKEFNDKESIITGDNSKTIIKNIQEQLDEYLIIDNILYEPASEPFYRIQTFGLGNNHGGTGFFIEETYNEKTKLTEYEFSANDYEKAIQYFDETARERGDTQSVGCYREDYIEVLMPKFVTLKQYRKYQIPITYTVEGYYSIEASSYEEAIKEVMKKKGSINFCEEEIVENIRKDLKVLI